MDVIRSIDNWIDEGLKLVQKSFASAFSLGMGWCGRLHCFCSVTEGIPSNDPSNFRFFFVRSTIVFFGNGIKPFLAVVCLLQRRNHAGSIRIIVQSTCSVAKTSPICFCRPPTVVFIYQLCVKCAHVH